MSPNVTTPRIGSDKMALVQMRKRSWSVGRTDGSHVQPPFLTSLSLSCHCLVMSYSGPAFPVLAVLGSDLKLRGMIPKIFEVRLNHAVRMRLHSIRLGNELGKD